MLQDCLFRTRQGETLTAGVLIPVWVQKRSNDEVWQGLLDEAHGHNLRTVGRFLPAENRTLPEQTHVSLPSVHSPVLHDLEVKVSSSTS